MPKSAAGAVSAWGLSQVSMLQQKHRQWDCLSPLVHYSVMGEVSLCPKNLRDRQQLCTAGPWWVIGHHETGSREQTYSLEHLEYHFCSHPRIPSLLDWCQSKSGPTPLKVTEINFASRKTCNSDNVAKNTDGRLSFLADCSV